MKDFYITLTPFFPSPTNFTGSYIYDQVKAIQKERDFEVIVITPANGLKEESYQYQGVAVHQIKLLDLPSFILPGLFTGINYNRLLSKLKIFTHNQLQNIKFIHGHVTYPFGMLAVDLAKALGAKSIVQHHGFDVMGYTNGRLKQQWFKRLNQNWINKYHVPKLNQADWNVGVSQKTLDALHAVKGYQPTQEYVLYNGVDFRKFYPVEGLKDEKYFTIGCVGNFWAIKDQLTLIKAVEILLKENLTKRIRLKLIGTGATLAICTEYVERHSLSNHVQFLPTIDHTELNNFYNTLNLFVLPSYYEAFGCVYTEAYACGVPFIGVYGQGIEELILAKNISYQSIKPKQEHELAIKINYFCQHENFKPSLNRSIDITNLIAQFLSTINQ
ncbi:glycosyltransferase family 4 protein [Pedobacter changchengzhani]|uniref:Glycosyltransferase family 4 protein n=1 Tax=Pedobacter changchengzhani TaxID=2529274 RepID=A0A4V3A0I3_9SPHI|nr:glycosyltransferase [Pedobacter changchengzhani]TDG37713.1 glycosyltransferase family 4 protein [Pedobacter changchengzhani]